MKATLSGSKLLTEREIQEEYELEAVSSELETLEIDLKRLQLRKSSLQEILEEAKKLGYREREPSLHRSHGGEDQRQGGSHL